MPHLYEAIVPHFNKQAKVMKTRELETPWYWEDPRPYTPELNSDMAYVVCPGTHGVVRREKTKKALARCVVEVPVSELVVTS